MNLQRKTRRVNFKRRSDLRCEKLEDRRLLAAEILFNADAGLLTINGTDRSDRATVSNADGMIHVNVETGEDTVNESFAADQVGAILFNGEAGSDWFENQTSIGSTARGGSGNDRLTGGSGADRLFGSSGRDVLRGGPGNDFLLGSDGADLLFGEDGDDEIEGASDRDILIGGRGRDDLDGGSWSDILIGGTTSYDDDEEMLLQIQRIWRANKGYDQRVIDVSNASTPLVLHETVNSDGQRDELSGGRDTDWLFLPGEFDEHADDADHVEFLVSLDNVIDVASNEQVSTVVHHAQDVSKRNEHYAMLGLVAYNQVTHTAVASGDWSAPSTWLNGELPQHDANVLVPDGIAVTVDSQLEQRLQTVRVDGLLNFATNADTELLVDTLIVSPQGTFQMGTQEQPISADSSARLVIVDNGAIDRDWDPLELSRGIIIHGQSEIYGSEKTPFVSLNRPAMRGDRVLELSEVPSNWKIGDKLVLAGTDRQGEQNEELEIESIDGATIRITAELDFNHTSPRADLSAHVANLSRNAVIESENTEEVRGHLMFMHTDSTNVNFAGIYNLGRTDKSVPANDTVLDSQFQIEADTGTNQRGRYGIHFHRAGHHGGHGAKVHGSVVSGSRGWGFVNHSSVVDFTSNVGYDITGAAFVTESGDELGRFDGNLSIFSTGSGESTESRNDIEDFGHQGNGFWFQGGGVSVTNNIAAGHAEDGFIFFTRGLREGNESRLRFPTEHLTDPSIANGRTSISVGELPLREFKNNEAYGNETGVATRFHKLGNSHEELSVIEDLRLWNNRRGLHLPYTNRVVVRNVEVIGTPDRPLGNGVTRNGVTRNVTYENITVEGYEYGIQIPNRGENTIVSGRLNNIRNIVVETARRERVVNIYDAVEFETPENLRGKTPYDVMLRTRIEEHNDSFEHIFYDDQILLHGESGVRRLYFHEQAADFVPFPELRDFVMEEHVGKSNQQLEAEFGLSLGGEIAPRQAVSIDSIFALVSPITGDSNGDGRFDSNDLVQIFQTNEYEDELIGNSTWADGDWNGDGEFNTQDLILAFQEGRYLG